MTTTTTTIVMMVVMAELVVQLTPVVLVQAEAVEEEELLHPLLVTTMMVTMMLVWVALLRHHSLRDQCQDSTQVLLSSTPVREWLHLRLVAVAVAVLHLRPIAQLPPRLHPRLHRRSTLTKSSFLRLVRQAQLSLSVWSPPRLDRTMSRTPGEHGGQTTEISIAFLFHVLGLVPILQRPLRLSP